MVDAYIADPLCGSGTIPIEAALMAANIAPGLERVFAAEGWDGCAARFARARKEAREQILPVKDVTLFASDIDPACVAFAEDRARDAGVAGQIRFSQGDVRDFTSETPYGFIVTNPPYGERLGEVKEVEQLYRDMGKTFRKLDTWSVYVITSHPEFERLYGKTAPKRRKLFNGRLACQYYQYPGPKPPRAAETGTEKKEGSE